MLMSETVSDPTQKTGPLSTESKASLCGIFSCFYHQISFDDSLKLELYLQNIITMIN